MKVLIADDTDAKAAAVESVLRAALATRPVDIRRSKSFRGAVKQLEEEVFDLLILDLVMPVRDGEAPSGTAGKQVLSELLDGSACHPPSHIICLTAFSEAATTLRTDAEKKLVHVVVYDETSDSARIAHQ